jgi:hypothetical protein
MGCGRGRQPRDAHRHQGTHFQSGYYPTDGASAADFSYSHLTVADATHLHWSQWSSTTQRVVDEVWIVQQHHGSFGVPVSKR